MIKILLICVILRLFISKNIQIDIIYSTLMSQEFQFLPVNSIQSTQRLLFPHKNMHITQHTRQQNHPLSFEQTRIVIICVIMAVLIIIFVITYYIINKCYSREQQILQNNLDIDQIIKIDFIYEKQKDWCTICLNTDCNLILQCNHYFHRQCFEGWMLRNISCPICKFNLIFQIRIINCIKCRKYCTLVKKQKLHILRMTEQECCRTKERKIIDL